MSALNPARTAGGPAPLGLNSSAGTRTRPREILLAAGLLSLLLAVTFFRVVFGGRTLLTSAWCPGTMPSGPYGVETAPPGLPLLDPGASSWQHEPWAARVRADFKSGSWPLWNPDSGAGAPLLANMQSAPFSPLRIPVHLFSSPAAWDAYFLLRLLLAGFFSYLFLRLWRRSPAAAFAGAVVFMLTGHHILYINMGHLDVDILLPALLLAFESLFRKRKPVTVAAAAMVVCVSVLGGMPESTFFVLLFAAAYYVFRTVSTAVPLRAGPSFYTGHALRFLTPLVLGLLLAGPQLFPFAEYLGRSWTSHAGSTGMTSNPLSGAVSLIVPYFFGKVHQNWNGLSSHALLPYLGGIPVLLALLAVLSGKPAEERRVVSFFSIFGLLFLAKAYGLAPVNWVGSLPLLDRLIFPKYAMPEVAFCLAALSAFGFDALRRSLISVKRMFAALGIFLSFLSLFLLVKPLEFFPHLKDPRVWRYAAAQTAVTLGAVAAFFLLALTVLRLRRAGKMSLALAAVLIVELIFYVPKGRAERHDPAVPPPYVDFLKADRSAFRILPLHGALHPNTNSYYGLQCVTALDAMYPSRYMAFLRSCLSDGIYDRFTGGEFDGDLEPHLPHLRFLNVKYIVTPSPLFTSIPDILHKSAITPADRWGIGTGRYTIEGRTRTVLSQHPPSTISYPLDVADETRLSFSIALDPSCWSPTMGDGVRFRVSVRDGSALTTVFDRTIDPKRNAGHRRWFEAQVDLGAFRGKTVEVVFETDPLKSSDFDWAGWGDIRFGNRSESGSLELVYDRELKIYRIKGSLPRARVVPRAMRAAGGRQALDLLKTGRLDPERYVIIEPDRAAFDGPGPDHAEIAPAGRAEILSYRSGEVIIDARAPAGGLLVLADTHDLGWRAFVDGRRRPVLKADYLFRGVALEPGRHTVRFEYAPRSFAWGWRASLLGLAGLAAAVLFSRRRRDMPKRGISP